MGQSILRIHNREDDKKEECGYRPYGMYGNYNGTDCFALPITDDENIQKFETLFLLERKRNSGLSLVIPFYSDEISIDHLSYSVIEQYFYPVLEGRLEVEIRDEDKVIQLDKNSIVASVDQIDFKNLAENYDRKIKSRDSLIKLFDFAKWILHLKDEDYYKLNELDIKQQPRWNKSLFSDEAGLEIVRDKFEKSERVAIKIPLKYHPATGSPKTCWYSAFLEKDTSLTRPENLFVRDGITISGITSLEKGLVRGVVIIHDSDLTKMLGDSENPAHTEWQPDSRNFKGKYIHGKEALGFVKRTLKELYDRLQRPIEGIQKDLLIDFFSIPIETQEEKKIKDLPKDDYSGEAAVSEPKIPMLNGRISPVLIEPIRSGLKVTKNPEAEILPDAISLKLGYDVPRGNPIKNYQELDFDVAKLPIVISSSGVYFTKKEKNILEFDIVDKSHFEIQLTGFDEKRDLFLKLQ
jgi:hypothetical protein